MSRSFAPTPNVVRSAGRWLSSRAHLFILAVVALCAAVSFTGCTDASIARARRQIAEGNYASAHDYFATEAAKSNQLSLHQRRVVMDGLCLTEYQIGAP